MEIKSKLGGLANQISDKSKRLADLASHTLDQNDDGKFDLSDVRIVTDEAKKAAADALQILKEKTDEQARLRELRALQPIQPDDLTDVDFAMPKLIRIVERDKRHAESALCQGSVGYWSDSKSDGLRIVNIFPECLDSFALSFYPDCDCGFYYVDPSAPGCYIALDEYFKYLQKARINELQKIAQDLGATYFRVTYKEEKATFADRKVDAHGKTKPLGKKESSADLQQAITQKEYVLTEIKAESHFAGHPPVKPQLKYWQTDDTIRTLIDMRMDATGPLTKQTYMLQMSDSSGLKERDAAKIDAMFAELKITGSATVVNEVKDESRRYLEYVIEF